MFTSKTKRASIKSHTETLCLCKKTSDTHPLLPISPPGGWLTFNFNNSHLLWAMQHTLLPPLAFRKFYKAFYTVDTSVLVLACQLCRPSQQHCFCLLDRCCKERHICNMRWDILLWDINLDTTFYLKSFMTLSAIP